MNYKVATEPVKKKKNPAKLIPGGTPYYLVGGVSESSLPARGTDKNVEQMLSDIVTRLERIEEKIDENVYPPESMIKPAFVKRLKKAQGDIAAGKGKKYNSMDDFIKSISE